MENIILLGYGNVGKSLHKLLQERGERVDYIIRSSGIYDATGAKIDSTSSFPNYVDHDSTLYVTLPSNPHAKEHLGYYLTALRKGATVITCEKAVLALHWDTLKPFMKQLHYSATVGGNSGILPAITNFHGKIREIKAVINGTLNIVSEESTSKSPEDIFYHVTTMGYAEPGAKNFGEVVGNEMQDVRYKSVILANHSKLFPQTVTLADIEISPYQPGKRCMLKITPRGISAGFLDEENIDWLPKGVNNALCINGKKIVEGPGAGPRATAERMYQDRKNF